MLNDIILLSENNNLFSSNWPRYTDSRIYRSILVDTGDKQQIRNAYLYCSEQQLPHFSITATVNQALQEDLAQFLLSFTFIPNYQVANNRIMLYLLAKDDKILAEATKVLQVAAQKQGITNLAIYQLQANQPGPGSSNSESIHLFTSADNLVEAYKLSLEQLDNCNKTYYLHAPQQEAKKLYEMITALEEDAKNKNPQLYQLAKEKQSLLVELESLKKRQQLVEHELNNYKLHLETIRSSHQAKELQDYYNNEYEVLPLWYKRFGHIIKAIMGKRSVRSLFTDNIKKRTD